MTIERLQKVLDENHIPAKLLYVQKTDFEYFEIIYTFDLNYNGKGRDYSNSKIIIEPEHDELVKDIKDAVILIGSKYVQAKGGE